MDNVTAMSSDMRAITADVRAGRGTLGGLLTDPSIYEDVKRLVGNLERNEILRSCLSELSPAHREIIDLVYYHERSIDEVSEIIGVPANTVKTRMFYARKRIGEMMAAKGIERHAI